MVLGREPEDAFAVPPPSTVCPLPLPLFLKDPHLLYTFNALICCYPRLYLSPLPRIAFIFHFMNTDLSTPLCVNLILLSSSPSLYQYSCVFPSTASGPLLLL